MAPFIWLVTGATSGIGAALVDEIIRRGDKAIAAGRNIENRCADIKSDDVALLELDMRSGSAVIAESIKKAWGIFGHIDVLVNNAGVVGLKSFEDADTAKGFLGDEFDQYMLESNVLGHMRTTRAILPFFRQQGSGFVAFTSSSAVYLSPPFFSHYSMTKAAISSLAEALDKELFEMGIRVVAFEAGTARTLLGEPRGDTATGQQAQAPPASEPYLPSLGEFGQFFGEDPSLASVSSTAKFARSIAGIIKQDSQVVKGRPWAARISLGSDGLFAARNKNEKHRTVLDRWEDVSSNTDAIGFKPANRWVYYSRLPGAEKDD